MRFIGFFSFSFFFFFVCFSKTKVKDRQAGGKRSPPLTAWTCGVQLISSRRP